MLTGYARVSKGKDQDTAAQIEVLKKAGFKSLIEHIDTTTSSGRRLVLYK